MSFFDTPQGVLYIAMVPDLLRHACSYLHPKFLDYIQGRHQDFSKDDLLWFAEEYMNVLFLERVVPSLGSLEKINIVERFLTGAIKKDSFMMMQYINQEKIANVHTLIRQHLIKTAKKYKRYHLLPWLKEHYPTDRGSLPWHRSYRVRRLFN